MLCDIATAFSYEEPQEIKDHFYYAHKKKSYHCPACLKIFKRAFQLVAHAESAGKCRIQQADQFKAVCRFARFVRIIADFECSSSTR